MTTCPACHTAGHSAQSCPSIRALLFAPEVCTSCGDVSAVPLCAACVEYERFEQVTADRWGVPWSLRADILEDSMARVAGVPF